MLPATPDDDDLDRRGAVQELDDHAMTLHQWAADWLPSIYMVVDADWLDVDDWFVWCEVFVLRLLRRAGFQVLFRGHSDVQLKNRAERICNDAWRSTNAQRRQTTSAHTIARTPEAQRRFERAAADHRARRRLVLAPDLQNDNSDSLPELNTNVEDPFVENDDMTLLIQLSLHSSLNAETEPGMNEKLLILPNVPDKDADGPRAVPRGLYAYIHLNKYAYRIHINPLKRNCKFGLEHYDSIQHFTQCSKMIIYPAYLRETLRLCVRSRKFALGISTSYEGENVINKSAAMRMTVSTKIYHMMKNHLTTDLKKFYISYAAARLALRLPADLSGGAERASVPRRG